MKTIVFLLLLTLSTLTLAESSLIKLRALVWSRPLAQGHELDYTYYGDFEGISMTLSDEEGLQRAEQEFIRSDFKINVKAFRMNKKDVPSYLILQTRITDKDKNFIAECSTYSSPERVNELGVGACTGRVQDSQFGVSYTNIIP